MQPLCTYCINHYATLKEQSVCIKGKTEAVLLLCSQKGLLTLHSYYLSRMHPEYLLFSSLWEFLTQF